MTDGSNQRLQQAEDILLDELMADSELWRAFLRDPAGTISGAAEWGVPLSDSERCALSRRARRLWERLTDELEARLTAAA